MIRSMLGVIRAPFLLLPPVIVLLGLSAAVYDGRAVAWHNLVLILVAAVMAHASVNALNEYLDFRNGLDAMTQRTPFSGGSGTLVRNPELAGMTLGIATFSLLVTMIIGIYFLTSTGLRLLPLGLLGIAIIVAYTPWITRSPLLSLISPGVAFGPLMVVGTDLILTGTYSATSVLVSLVPFFLVNNLLLLNQFPDRDADTRVGRRNMVIVLGRKRSAILYGLFNVLAFVVLGAGVLFNLLPVPALIAFVMAPVAWRAFHIALRNAEDVERLIPAMGLNVLLNLLTPVLIAVALLFAHIY